MEEVKSMVTGQVDIKEIFDEEQEATESDNEKYLGQVISNDGSNVKKRHNKGRERNRHGEHNRKHHKKCLWREISF